MSDLYAWVGPYKDGIERVVIRTELGMRIPLIAHTLEKAKSMGEYARRCFFPIPVKLVRFQAAEVVQP